MLEQQTLDEQIKKQLMDETDRLLRDDATEWSVIEALWRPYVDSDDVEAQFCLANSYLDYGFEEGPEQDREMRHLLQIAADKGHPDATYRLCNRYEEGEERDALLIKAGELGSIEAQRDLGALYATGDWTGPKDPAQGAEWYHKAAERGHPDAQYNLGFMYLLGEGVPVDTEEGLRWLHRSAKQEEGHAFRFSGHAFRLLADLYRHGYYGVPLDIKQADYWDEKYRIYNPEQWAKDHEATR
jgi:TPR repeat protein